MRPYALGELVLGDVLREETARHPSRTFLRFREGDLTYAEVDALTDRVASGLAACGVHQHDPVAVMLPNCPEFLTVTFALARLGAVAVPVNTAYRGELLRHVLENSEALLLVVDQPLLDEVARVEGHLQALETIVVRQPPGNSPVPTGLSKAMLPLHALPSSNAGERAWAQVHPSDLQAIMYTSGTTGPSKGVMVPHAHALTDAQDFLRYMDYRPEETIYCPLPLFHAAALWDGLMAALLAGSSIAIVERFSASRFWEDVRRFGANVAMGIFSMIPILLKQPPTPEDRDHPLRSFYVGKSTQDEAFHARFGVHSVETYTSTEVGIGTGSPYGHWREGSCGKANEVTHEVRVVDALDREVGPDEPGELVLRPRRPFVMTTGYYRAPEVTARAFRNLWFHTGDFSRRDRDGYFHFIERIKTSIRRRGEFISAFELEREVNEHPDVLECAAFGVPSELEEDDVMIAVVRRTRSPLGEAELAAFCRERLPAFMVPRYIEFVRELPKTAIGKLATHELRTRGDHGVTAATWDAERAGT